MINDNFSIKYSLVGLAAEFKNLADYLKVSQDPMVQLYRDFSYLMPAFSRELFVQGYGKLTSINEGGSSVFKIPGVSKDCSQSRFESSDDILIDRSVLEQDAVARLCQGLDPVIFRDWASMKFTCTSPCESERPLFIFRGAFQGPLSRFNKRLLSENEAYLSNSGNIHIDNFLTQNLRGLRTIDANDKHSRITRVVYDSFPREAIYNTSFLNYYSDYLYQGRDAQFVPLSASDSYGVMAREQIDNIVVRPKTWIVLGNNFNKTIFDNDWIRKSSFPKKVSLRLMGGDVLLNTSCKENLLFNLKKIERVLSKKISYFYFEESFSSSIPPCEITIGYKNDQ